MAEIRYNESALCVDAIEAELRKLYGSDLLRDGEIQDYLRVSPSTCSRMRKLGKYPPSIKVGVQLRVHVRDLARWIVNGGCGFAPAEGRKRGRPVGSRNKKKDAGDILALSMGGQA